MAFVGRGEAKMLVEFPACRKWKSASCASTKRVAAVDKIEDKRKPEDFIGHRNRRSLIARNTLTHNVKTVLSPETPQRGVILSKRSASKDLLAFPLP